MNIIVKQHDIKDCGICCLKSIMRYYGGDIPLETLRLDAKTNKNGTTAFNLIKTAQRYGFNAIGKKITEIEDNKILPAIAHVELPNGLNHYVVVTKINKNILTVMDPAKGIKKYTKEEFYKIWTNIILIFKPYHAIPHIKTHNALKEITLKILKEEKTLIIKLLLINIFTTVISILLSYYFKIILSSLETNYINTTIIIMIIFLILSFYNIIFRYTKNKLKIYLNKNIDIKIIIDFIEHIFRLPLNVVKNRTSGEIISKINELNNIKELFSEIITTIFLDITLVIGSAIFLYNISSKLFLILCIIALIYILIGIISIPIVNKKINNNIDLETDCNSNIVENIDSIETIKNMNIEEYKIEQITIKYIEYLEDSLSYANFINNKYLLDSFITEIGMFIISSIGIIMIYQNNLSLINLMTFNSLLNYFIDPIEKIINILPKYQLIKLSINKINEFTSIKEEKLNNSSFIKTGDIKFEDITYSYNNYNNVLNKKRLIIQENDHITIKGKSGCGKSTLFKMLNRSIDDYKGNIKIGDINIKDYSLQTIRSNIVYISQREKIFTDTIKNNILLNNKITDYELQTILKITKVDEIIDKKNFRLDSLLYDSGYNLSGGERQRIILARALVKKPKVLVLDESLSELDSSKEKEIIKNIDNYLKNTTLIYVSHNNKNYLKKVKTIK